MGIILKVTPEELKTAASDIEKQINDIEKQFQSVETEITASRSYWEGDASDSHKSQYDSLKEDITEVIANLKCHPVNLLKMAGLYEETEAEAVEAAEPLSSDVIV